MDYGAIHKILMIEDNPGDAKIVELLLGQSDFDDYALNRVSTLTEAIEYLHTHKNTDAVLLDLSLPDSMGFETLERLFAHHPDQNVIVLTGYSDKTLGVKAVQAGAQDFLVKGVFDGDLLAKSLRFSIERNNVLKSLEESQRIAHIGNWEFNEKTGKFVGSNEFFRILELSNLETLSELELLNYEVFNIILQAQKQALKGSIKKDVQFQISTGHYKYLHLQCSASKTEKTTIYKGIVQDISERKSAEIEMFRTQERYQSIFNKSKDSIVICDLDGLVVDFNPATLELFDSEESELQGFYFLRRIIGEKFEQDFLKDIKLKKNIKDLEVEIKTYQGRIKICQLTGTLLEADDFSGFNAVIRDITEKKQAEELRKVRDLEKQKASLREQFIASISHEMRTPMNAILGMSNLMLGTDMSKEQDEYIRSIHQSSEVLLGIVNDILDISSMKNGKIEIIQDTFNLHELLANMVNVMQYKLNEKDLSFEMIFDPVIPQYLIGDKLRLNQILYNLLGNAIKFTETGKIQTTVSLLDKTKRAVQLEFAVQDTGIGIPKNRLNDIFDSFTRVRTKQKIYEGTGLGLSIAKGLIEQQGGTIWVESEEGVGSIFHFRMEFEIGQNISATRNKESKPILPEGVPFSLLLVEDHKLNQLVARKTINKKWPQAHITFASNGQEAVEAVMLEDFDIILMDIQMPVMDGFEATDAIRKMPPPKCNIPILAMTAHANIEKQEQYSSLKMNGFILKPFEPLELFEKISLHMLKIYS